MDDGQLCVLTGEGIELQHLESCTSIPVAEQVREIEWSPETAEKAGYGHFMHKEIHEQPRVVLDTIGEWMADPLHVLDHIKRGLKMTTDVRKLHIVACGTSYHAALIGKYMIEGLARVPVEVDIASEYRYREPLLDDRTLFISITQSGETADTLAAQREARARGAATLTICNVVGSTSSREADAVLYTHAGPEIGVASTKAFTAQMATLCLLAIAWGTKSGRLPAAEAKTLTSQLAEIPAHLEQSLTKDAEIKDLAGDLLAAKDFLFLGRGISYPIALEGALKLKEISYIHAEGYPAGEMKHGPIALIEEKVPVIMLAPRNNVFEKILSNIEEVKARGGRVIAVTDSPHDLLNKADDMIEVPAVHALLSPFVTTIPLQLLAYHMGVLKGCDVDQPRNLAKSVTVE
jgi:glucosamine--fructose-6-phosphate aminotransferase (isomerizing)